MCAGKKAVAEPVSSVFFRRAALALAVSAAFASATGIAGEKLDMSFIQGGAGVNPEVWAALNGSYAPGRYLVDLSLNGKEAGKQILDVTPQDSNELCLTEAWLTKAGVYVSADYFREGYDATRQCYVLTKAPSVKVDFDVSTQSLALSIPQKGLVKMPENVDWDYGTSAFRVNYNANANTGRNNTSAFGSADLKANIGHWVVSSSATVKAAVTAGITPPINMFVPGHPRTECGPGGRENIHRGQSAGQYGNVRRVAEPEQQHEAGQSGVYPGVQRHCERAVEGDTDTERAVAAFGDGAGGSVLHHGCAAVHQW